MKKTTKKITKVSHKKAVKDLEVKPIRGGTVRGGDKRDGSLSPPLGFKTSPGG